MSYSWQVLPVAALADRLHDLLGPRRPSVVAVNGYSSSGKTTLAGRLAAALPSAAVLHTDDLAWYESVFGWDDLLVTGVLEPLRRGAAVRYRPPAWERRGRPGAIEVPAGTSVLLLEGVGSGRASLAGQLAAHIWVESYVGVRVDRNRTRVAGTTGCHPTRTPR